MQQLGARGPKTAVAITTSARATSPDYRADHLANQKDLKCISCKTEMRLFSDSESNQRVAILGTEISFVVANEANSF